MKEARIYMTSKDVVLTDDCNGIIGSRGGETNYCLTLAKFKKGVPGKTIDYVEGEYVKNIISPGSVVFQRPKQGVGFCERVPRSLNGLPVVIEVRAVSAEVYHTALESYLEQEQKLDAKFSEIAVKYDPKIAKIEKKLAKIVEKYQKSIENLRAKKFEKQLTVPSIPQLYEIILAQLNQR
jgi:hypothetical protein